jgi:predicted nuclease with TOPRIM domain
MNQIMVNAVEFDALLKEVQTLKKENERLTNLLKDAQDRIRVLKEEVGFAERGYTKLIAERERTAVIETIDELMGMESDRHPMFSEGYDYALDHIKRFVQGRRKNERS